MTHTLRYFLSIAVLISAVTHTAAQQQTNTTGCPGVPGACGYPSQPSQQVQSISGPGNPSPQNGNGTLGQIYNFSKCGLGFTQASQRLGRRFTPQGIPQPATFAISGIPACAVIEQAYVWAEGSGNGMAQNVTIVNPNAVTQTFPLALVGSGPDKCWGYAGSHTYRANVTAAITGNGNYILSGILTNPPTPGNDMDGATLMIIYSDPTAAFTGTMIIHDGAVVVNGGSTTRALTGMNVCQNVTAANATAFCMIGDIQMAGQNLTMNGTPSPFTWNWWNYVQVNTTLTTGQTTANYTLTSGGDCFNLCVIGMYFRTTCVPCTTSTLAIAPTVTGATCSNCNGSATVNVTPAGSYNYSWAPSGGNAATATGLCAGTYTVTVSNACNSATMAVTVPTTGGGVTLTNAGQTNIDCFGNCIGAASVNVTSGTGPFTYTWAPSGGNTAAASGLCAGTYTCSVSDAAGCSGTQTFTITSPPVLTSTLLQTNVLCNGGNTGTAAITAVGGVGNYTYSWSPAVANTTNGNTNTATGLSAISYVATIVDGNGCTTTATFNVGEPPVLTAAATSTPATCNNPNGSVTATAGGGNGQYSYLWIPGNYTTATVTNLPAGLYGLQVTDANGCVALTTVTVASAATPVVSIASFTDVSCFSGNNGSATATNTGGVGPFTYSWSTGDTSATASNLPAGTYTIVVTDANGCFDSAVVTITEPTQLTSTQSVVDVTCFGANTGTGTMTGTGGSGAYTFAWTPSVSSTTNGNSNTGNSLAAGNYVCTITDANGCTTTQTLVITEPPAITVQMQSSPSYCNQPNGYVNAIGGGGTGNLSYVWNPGNLAQQSSNSIPPGNYSVTVTDQNNCQLTDTITVANTPGIVLAGNPSTSVSCFGGNDGSASVSASGGVGTYTYAWFPNVSTTATATSLIAGNYVVIVVDTSGCSSTVTVTVTQPVQLTASAATNPAAVCEGQSTTLSASPFGGTPGYTALWQPGNLTGLQTTFIPAATGTYTLTLTDLNGCTATAQTTVTVNPQPVPQFTAGTLQGCAPLCVNFTDQSNAGSWVWGWDFGDGNFGTGAAPTNCFNQAGSYNVQLTVSDPATGCTATITYNNYITVFANPVAAFGSTPDDATMVNPTIFFTDSSLAAVNWSWSFGDLINSASTQQNPSFTYPGPGCYEVTLSVTSSNGCTDITSDSVCIGLEATLFVPNAFTPNGDGVNDMFFPQGIGLDPAQYELWIFDRWGNMIFFSDSPNLGWDGKANGGKDMAQIDTYVWKVKCVDVTGQKHNLLGTVTLVK
ncbi:MAG: PKD domain-containing protein [Bacteroidota bacterium]